MMSSMRAPIKTFLSILLHFLKINTIFHTFITKNAHLYGMLSNIRLSKEVRSTKEMKKGNKKLAQERRAKERKKQARRQVLEPLFKIGVPILILFAFIAVMVVNPFAESDTDDSKSSDTETTSYLTDTTLTIEDGDTVNIDYVGTIDGVEFTGGNTNGAGTDLTIGSGKYIDDFEEQLIGAHPGDTVEVNVTFPEDYGKDEVNGKDARFEVVVNGIYE